MAIPALAIAAGSMGLNYLSNQQQFRQQRDLMKRQQKYNRENMMLANNMERRNAVDTPQLTVEGLEKAGFSPAMANGNFTDVAAPSPASSGLPSAPSLDLASGLMQAKQMEYYDAQIDAMKEKTRGDKIENNNKDQESKSAVTAMKSSLDRLISVGEKAKQDMSSYKALRELLNDDANAGTLSAITKAVNAERALSSSLRLDLSDALDATISEGKINANVAADISKMDHLSRKMLERQLALSLKQIALVGANIELTNKQTKLTSEQRRKVEQERYNLIDEQKKLSQEIDNLVQKKKLDEEQTKLIKNSNFLEMYRNGDYAGETGTILIKLLQALIGKL